MRDELYHYGILGMKWGVRRYQKYGEGGYTPKEKKKWADNYSEQQRTRDKRIYGRGAVRRINKRMINGESVQSARHNEVLYNEMKKKTLKKGKRIAGAVLAVASPIIVKTIIDNNPIIIYRSKQFVNNIFNRENRS